MKQVLNSIFSVKFIINEQVLFDDLSCCRKFSWSSEIKAWNESMIMEFCSWLTIIEKHCSCQVIQRNKSNERFSLWHQLFYFLRCTDRWSWRRKWKCIDDDRINMTRFTKNIHDTFVVVQAVNYFNIIYFFSCNTSTEKLISYFTCSKSADSITDGENYLLLKTN